MSTFTDIKMSADQMEGDATQLFHHASAQAARRRENRLRLAVGVWFTKEKWFEASPAFLDDGFEYVPEREDGTPRTKYVGEPTKDIDHNWEQLHWGRFFLLTEDEAKKAWGPGYEKYWAPREGGYIAAYFLKAWESALKEHCDFKGQVPYWDWTTDWMDLATSSIWNNETGFGGDGDPKSPVVVGGGRCVTDGPFSHLRPIRYNRTYVEHCLARGFKTTDIAGRPLGPWFGPESIGKLMRSPSYREFEWEMENRLHNRIHRAVSGDFLAFAAGNDPIFYLHHAQIDRLWWKWQQEDAKTRLYQYEGEHQRDSTGNPTLSDILQFDGFIEDAPVSHVMDTQNKFLCYRY
ncbi:Tyrosinase ustQ [Colletotrichum tropicale]|nr:Tyrosinase ustQ [Colletotrichum tropicale]